jgi:hypothetical protein
MGFSPLCITSRTTRLADGCAALIGPLWPCPSALRIVENRAKEPT